MLLTNGLYDCIFIVDTEGQKMRTRVQKWGNSLAIRVPKSFADEIGLAQYSSIQLMTKEGALVVIPEHEPRWKLEELLEKVTEDNIHREWETGSAEGDELW
jgi:antitoxin MazE